MRYFFFNPETAVSSVTSGMRIQDLLYGRAITLQNVLHYSKFRPSHSEKIIKVTDYDIVSLHLIGKIINDEIFMFWDVEEEGKHCLLLICPKIWEFFPDKEARLVCDKLFYLCVWERGTGSSPVKKEEEKEEVTQQEMVC